MNYKICITTTSRQPRIGEQNGIDYHFLTRDRFQEKVANGGFIEHVEFDTNLYGLSIDAISIDPSSTCLLIVENKGFDNIKNYVKKNNNLKFQTVFLDIEPKQLKENMLARGDSLESIQKRINNDTISLEMNKIITKYSDTNNILTITDLLELNVLKDKIEDFIEEDTQLLLIIGPSGSGKDTIQNFMINNS